MLSEEIVFKTSDGMELHLEIKENASPLWLIATHGIGEHSGRHAYLSDLFGQDFNICHYDLRNHGKSAGKKSHVTDFQSFINDLHEIIFYLKERYKMKNYILFGHSMGALITSAYLQNKVDKDFYPSKVYLNAPPVGYPGPLGAITRMTPRGLWQSLSRLPVSLPLKDLIDLSDLSHNSEVKTNYINDEYNCLRLQSCLILGMVKTSLEVFSRPLRPQCPAFVSVGSGDRIVSVSELKSYFSMVEKAFQLRIFDGAYHEIHNEIEVYRKPYFEHLKATLLDQRYV